MALPFAAQQFDVVVCTGVIPHTHRRRHRRSSCSTGRSGPGWLVIDHYTYEIAWYTKTAPLFRRVLKRLPPETSIGVTERLVDLALPMHKRVAGSRLRSVLFRLSPILTRYQTYPELSDDLQRRWALVDTHDSLTDYFKHFRTRGQIRGLLERLGLDEIWCEYGGNGVEAHGRRPVAV